MRSVYLDSAFFVFDIDLQLAHDLQAFVQNLESI